MVSQRFLTEQIIGPTKPGFPSARDYQAQYCESENAVNAKQAGKAGTS